MQPRLGLRKGHARLETAERLEEVPLVSGIGIELKRNPHVGIRIQHPDVWTFVQDADDDVGIAAERHRLADDRRIASKATLPEPLTEHGDPFPVRAIFLGGECAAPRHRYPRQSEIVRADGIIFGAGDILWSKRRVSFKRKSVNRAIEKWRRRRYCRRFDSGNGLDPLKQLLSERHLFWVISVLCAGKIDLHRQNTFGFETRINFP